MFHNAFNNDYKLQELFDNFINENNIDLIVETGTSFGYSTEYFAKFNKPVITTEILPDVYEAAKNNLKHLENITFLLGDSATLLESILPKDEKRILFFLDAHACNDKSLDRELDLIASYKNITPFISIHDFLVPGTSLGYDTHDGQVYSHETFQNAFKKIYERFGGYDYKYNDNSAIGSRRGCIFIKPRLN